MAVLDGMDYCDGSPSSIADRSLGELSYLPGRARMCPSIVVAEPMFSASSVIERVIVDSNGSGVWMGGGIRCQLGCRGPVDQL